MSDSARRGLEVFRDPKRGNCAVGHSIGEKDSLFTDNEFHDIRVGVKDEKLLDLGHFLIAKVEADMHDGSIKTLDEVRDCSIGAGSSNPHRDKEIRVLDFQGARRPGGVSRIADRRDVA